MLFSFSLLLLFCFTTSQEFFSSENTTTTDTYTLWHNVAPTTLPQCVDMVFLVDRTASMNSYYSTIRLLASSLRNSNQSSCSNRYGLTLYHKSVSNVPIGAGGKLFGTAAELVSWLNFSTTGREEDGLLGIYSIIEVYQFREDVVKHIVLFTDEPRNEVATNVNISLIQSLLEENNIILSSVTLGARFYYEDPNRVGLLSVFNFSNVTYGIYVPLITPQNIDIVSPASIQVTDQSMFTNYIETTWVSKGIAFNLEFFTETNAQQIIAVFTQFVYSLQEIVFAPCAAGEFGDGSKCSNDTDGDGYPDQLVNCNGISCIDNCPIIYNPDQEDCNSDGVGDICDNTCPEETDTTYNLTWVCTKGGDTANVFCAQGEGIANRKCLEIGAWNESIDTIQCISTTFGDIIDEAGGNVTKQFNKIADIVSSTELKYGGDIDFIVGVIEIRSQDETQDLDTLEKSAIIFNTLLRESNQAVLNQTQKSRPVAEKMLSSIERQTNILVRNQSIEVRIMSQENIFVELRVIKPDQTTDDIVTITAPNIMTSDPTQPPPSITLPIRDAADPRQTVSLSVVVLRNLGNLITNMSDRITAGSQGLLLSQFDETKIVSALLSVNLFKDGKQVTDTGAVINLPIDRQSLARPNIYYKSTCMFLRDVSSSHAQWDDSGIANVSTDAITSEGVVPCQVGHLTAFVVLVGVRGLSTQSIILNVISYVGCAVSLVCLIFSVAIYVIFGRKLLRKIYHFVHFQLALSLLLLYLVFLSGLEAAYDADIWQYIPCKLISALMQYLLLVVFLWMLMEGIVILIMIMLPFHRFSWKHFVAFSAISWLLPLPYIAVLLPFYHNYYISPPVNVNSTTTNSSNTTIDLEPQANYCWIHSDEHTQLILSVTVPLVLIIVLNIIIFTIVFVRCVILIGRQRSLSGMQRSQKTGLKLVRLSIVMFPALGFGWTFGLLAISTNLAVFAWIFTILGSSQGLIILFCVLLIRKDIQRSIIDALNLKAKFDTISSRISSQFTQQTATKSTAVFHPESEWKQPEIKSYSFQEDTKSKLELARDMGLVPPVVEIEELLMFYEARGSTQQETELCSENKDGEFDLMISNLELIMDRLGSVYTTTP